MRRKLKKAMSDLIKDNPLQGHEAGSKRPRFGLLMQLPRTCESDYSGEALVNASHTLDVNLMLTLYIISKSWARKLWTRKGLQYIPKCKLLGRKNYLVGHAV